MKPKSTWIAMGVVLSCFGLAVPTAAMDERRVIASHEIKWLPAPGALPKGAEMAVLYGDPSKEGLFAMRLRMPKGYRIPPHTHPKPEVVTVLSGALRFGSDETGDPEKARPISAGGFFALPPAMIHYVSMDQDTVIQLNSNGPWSISTCESGG